MAADDAAGGGQAQPDAAGIAGARAFQPVEGGEDLLELRLRDAGAVVVDVDAGLPAGSLPGASWFRTSCGSLKTGFRVITN